jgi:dethiobiotin synthetase
LFITGTGTGVGKTVLTALLLRHLRRKGRDALAVKPFCSGSRDDARLLHQLQKKDLTLAETNPFFFKPPLAPWVAAGAGGGPRVSLRQALREIRGLGKRCEILLVEGSGGVLAPLGRHYAAAEIISHLRCETVIVARNCLGAINHTLLTAKYLQSIGVEGLKIVMMPEKRPDLASRSNISAICELLPGIPVFSLPYLGREASKLRGVKKSEKKVKKTLAQVLGDDKL